MESIKNKNISSKINKILRIIGISIVIICILNIIALGNIAKYNNSINQSLSEYKTAIESYNTNKVVQIKENLNDALSHTYKRIYGTLIFDIIIPIYLIMVILFVKKMCKSIIINPIQEINDKIKYISDGDLTIDFNIKESDKVSKDEVVHMKLSMNNMINQLHDVICNVINISNDIDNSSNELEDYSKTITNSYTDITSAMQEVTTGTCQIAESMQTATENMNIMSNSIESINSSTDDLVVSSNHLSDTKNIMLETLNELDQITSGIINDISETNIQIEKTNESVELIKKSIELIQDLASQTHLLSLNASIESSRHGNGAFATIATEVRSLAESSKDTANTIDTILSELGSNYNKIIETMKISTNSINEQVEKINDTKQKFGSLDDDIQLTTDKINQINQSVSELAGIRSVIVDIITDLSAFTEQNSAATEETLASMEMLNDVTAKIKGKALDLNSKTDVLKSKINYFTIQ